MYEVPQSLSGPEETIIRPCREQDDMALVPQEDRGALRVLQFSIYLVYLAQYSPDLLSY